MRRRWFARRAPAQAGRALAGGALHGVTGHWALGLFSLLAAFAIWVVVEDVENPRAEGLVPSQPGQAVSVEPRNVPDGFIVADIQQIQVNVEARRDDLPELRAGDFRATVDLADVSEEGTFRLGVKVEARRSGVRVLNVVPSTVEVRVERGASREVAIVVNRLGQLPEGYRESSDPVVDPAFATIYGRQDLIASVEKLQVDVNLSGVRDEHYSIDGEIAARTAAGNTVNVTITPARARVAFAIEQTFSQRTLALVPTIVGNPAPGYIITNIVVEPATVVVSGPKLIVDRLSPLTVEKLDITGAKGPLTRSQQIERPANVSIERQTVTVRVEIKAIECSAQATAPCGTAVLYVGVEPLGVPPGLAVEPGVYTTEVRLSGPLDQLALIKPTSLRAVASLSGATAGTALYTVNVSLLAASQVKIESVALITIRLIPVTTP
ncbi:MAG: hypothetical protein HY875_09800 [Chloroflexi bacterium]|nr:hypothetical protein [Chloroflexota bacterium]